MVAQRTFNPLSLSSSLSGSTMKERIEGVKKQLDEGITFGTF